MAAHIEGSITQSPKPPLSNPLRRNPLAEGSEEGAETIPHEQPIKHGYLTALQGVRRFSPRAT